jgi:hypothetical protein
VAGIDVDEPRWIRLFPIPFRDLPVARRFRKYEVIELAVTPSADPRPESLRPIADSIVAIDYLGPERAHDRHRFVEPLIRPSMCWIRRQQVMDGTSLGAFRPAEPPELLVEEDRTPWEPDKQLIVDQPSMLMPSKRGLEKVPFRFSYRYRCEGESACRGHTQSIIDWEIAEAFRRWRRSYGETGARDRVIEKWTETLWAPDRDTCIFTGNQFRNHGSFLVLGVFWPKRTTGGERAGPVQGVLLPP